MLCRYLPLLLPLACGMVSHTAWAVSCDNSGLKNRLLLQLEPTVIEVNHSLDYAGIQQESGIKPLQGMPNAFVGGFTKTSVSTSFDMNFHAKPTADGRLCVAGTVKLTFSQPKAVVYMPKDAPANSCLYQVTYTHEMQHVAIFQRGLRRVLQTEGQALRHEIEHLPVGVYANEDAAKKVLTARLEIWQKRMQTAIASIERDQGQIDTVENYRREGEKVGRCQQRRQAPNTTANGQ